MIRCDLLRLNTDQLPLRSPELEAGFRLQAINGKHPQLLLIPQPNEFRAGKYARYMCGMRLKSGANGKTESFARVMGQLCVCDERLLGMFTEGSVKLESGDHSLDGARGTVYCFSLDHVDASDASVKTNWRGKAIEATVRSRTTQSVAFTLQLFSAAAFVDNAGHATPSSLTALLKILAEKRAAVTSQSGPPGEC